MSHRLQAMNRGMRKAHDISIVLIDEIHASNFVNKTLGRVEKSFALIIRGQTENYKRRTDFKKSSRSKCDAQRYLNAIKSFQQTHSK